MAPKPKKQDYKPSEAEKIQASVAKARFDKFKNDYTPKLLELRDLAMEENFRDQIRGRMNAVVEQQIGQYGATYRGARDVANLGTTTTARQSQLQKGDAAANEIRNKLGVDVIAASERQNISTQTGLNLASRIGANEVVQKAKQDQAVATAKFSAGVQLGGAALIQGIRNKRRGDPFFGGSVVGGGDASMEFSGGAGYLAPVDELTFRPTDRRRSIGDRLGDGIFGGFFGRG